MGYQALITLDLKKDVDSKKREKFYEHLKKERWRKLPNLTTAWECSFKDEVTRASAISTCKTDLQNAASYAGVSSYTAAIQVGKGKVQIL